MMESNLFPTTLKEYHLSQISILMVLIIIHYCFLGRQGTKINSSTNYKYKNLIVLDYS